MSREQTPMDDPAEGSEEGTYTPSPLPSPLMASTSRLSLRRDASLETKEGFTEKSDTKTSDEEKSSDDMWSDQHQVLTQKDSVESKDSLVKTETKTSDESDAMKRSSATSDEGDPMKQSFATSDEGDPMKQSYAQSDEAGAGMEESELPLEDASTLAGTTSTEGGSHLDPREIDSLINRLESLKLETVKSLKPDKKTLAECEMLAERLIGLTVLLGEESSDDESDDEEEDFDALWDEYPRANPGEKYEELEDLCRDVLDATRKYILDVKKVNKVSDSPIDSGIVDRVVNYMREINEEVNLSYSEVLQKPTKLSSSKNLSMLIHSLSVHVDGDTLEVLKKINAKRLDSLHKGFKALQTDFVQKLNVHKAEVERDLKNLCDLATDMRMFCEETEKLRLTLYTWGKIPLPVSQLKSWNDSMKDLANTAQKLFTLFSQIRLRLNYNMGRCYKYRKSISNNIRVFLATDIDGMFVKDREQPLE